MGKDHKIGDRIVHDLEGEPVPGYPGQTWKTCRPADRYKMKCCRCGHVNVLNFRVTDAAVELREDATNGEWVKPNPIGYIMTCGCGLRHRMIFEVFPEPMGLTMRGHLLPDEGTTHDPPEVWRHQQGGL